MGWPCTRAGASRRVELHPYRVSGPAGQVISLEEAKEQLGYELEESAADARVARLIRAAESYFDGWSGILGRCLLHQEWCQPLRGWPASRVIRLPFPDVQEGSVRIAYRDPEEEEQELPPAAVRLGEDREGSYLRLTGTLPALGRATEAPLQVRFTAGYGASGEEVPEEIRSALLLLIAHWDLHREAVVIGAGANALPFGVASLIAGHRRQRV